MTTFERRKRADPSVVGRASADPDGGARCRCSHQGGLFCKRYKDSRTCHGNSIGLTLNGVAKTLAFMVPQAVEWVGRGSVKRSMGIGGLQSSVLADVAQKPFAIVCSKYDLFPISQAQKHSIES